MVTAALQHERLWFTLLSLAIVSCGGEANNGHPNSPSGGCGPRSACAGGGSSPSGGEYSGGGVGPAGGSSPAGGANSETGAGVGSDAGAETGGQCSGSESGPAEVLPWATWPMPNPSSSGLPNPARYDTSKQGVVIDQVTGLMWQRETPAESDFAAGAAHCAEFGLAGYCDWRLPTRIELVSLVDFTLSRPALDSTAFPAASGEYWSSSALDKYRWRIGSDGATRALTETMAPTALARCVRAHVAHPAPEPRYQITGQAPDDLVTDRGTGLVWQRRPGTTTYSFADAEPHCAAFGGGGFRVPSMKELQTVMDETKSASSLIDAEVFPDFPTTANVTFWTSSPSAGAPGRAWFVRGASTLAAAVDADLSAKFYVRCVR